DGAPARSAGLLALAVPEGALAKGGIAAAVDAACGGAVTAVLAGGDFKGRAGESALAYPPGLGTRLLVVGLGPAIDAPAGAGGPPAVGHGAARGARPPGGPAGPGVPGAGRARAGIAARSGTGAGPRPPPPHGVSLGWRQAAAHPGRDPDRAGAGGGGARGAG